MSQLLDQGQLLGDRCLVAVDPLTALEKHLANTTLMCCFVRVELQHILLLVWRQKSHSILLFDIVESAKRCSPYAHCHFAIHSIIGFHNLRAIKYTQFALVFPRKNAD